ncbi:MAG TPA: 4-hydroxy-3-methylbut-2-enyl diphosphate reductase [bacterium]|nr:4-hydroxy-3-methylbut-2-enyl diphosphate reductase [bacterium]
MPEVEIAAYSGFCNGADRCVRLVEEALETGPVYTIGPVLHNPDVVDYLRKAGARIAGGPQEVPPGAVVVTRAHGISPADFETLGKISGRVIDGTCGNVSAIHEKIEHHKSSGRTIYIAGDPAHAETKSHVSRAGSDAIVVESVSVLSGMLIEDAPSAVVAQTSFDREEYTRIVDYLKRAVQDLVVEDTLCGWMGRAREAAAELAGRVDIMIVLGGKNSANTGRLAEVCGAAGALTVFIENEAGLSRDDFQGVKRIGITAGASTPGVSINKLTDWLQNEIGAKIRQKKDTI